MSIEYVDSITILTKKKTHKPRSEATMWRQREDGGYNNNAKDPDYFKKYFQTYGKTPFICDICGKTVSSKSIKARHMKTNYCMKALEEKNKNLLNV